MIEFNRFTLANGLKVIHHFDANSPIIALNIVYNVGAKDEDSNKTGFAHLFEHLMFGGSKNIESYDEPVEKSGGENNAFTNNDITNYYLTIPKINIETALWLESDRMLELDFSEKSLAVQKNVVVEEFKQRYLNQPYGDVWLLLRPLVYQQHPYQWPTIGKEVNHIQNANLQDVKDFFFGFYAPNNAILSIAGDLPLQDAQQLIEKWFSNIEPRQLKKQPLPIETKQTEPRLLVVERDVPATAIYKAYKICGKIDDDFHIYDMISDLLSNGKSSRFNQYLVKEQKLFSEIDAYVLGEHDPGMFVISGKLYDGVSIEQAEQAIEKELQKIRQGDISDHEIEKVKNKFESNFKFTMSNNLYIAMSLGHYELLGDANWLNQEVENYRNVTIQDICTVASAYLIPNNCSTLHYLSKR